MLNSNETASSYAFALVEAINRGASTEVTNLLAISLLSLFKNLAPQDGVTPVVILYNGNEYPQVEGTSKVLYDLNALSITYNFKVPLANEL